MLVREDRTAPVRKIGTRLPTLAVVMPAYNEEGLPEFLAELELHLRPLVSELMFVVVDDTSRIPVTEVLSRATPALRSKVTIVRNEVNLGHGPSALRAYRCGLAHGADLVLHVDGDGQFFGADVATLVHTLWSVDEESAGVVGVRSSRTDPWFRSVLTRVAKTLVTAGSDPVRDANTPLRVYRRDAIAGLLDVVDAMATVPHLQFSILERRSGLAMGEIAVTHRVRRGESEVGTTWQGRAARLPLPTRRLLRFSVRAFWEVLGCLRGSERCKDAVPALAGRSEAAA